VVIALLAGFNRTVAAEGLRLAAVTAPITASGVAVVALLATLLNAIAADLQLTGRTAAIVGVGIAIVALLVALNLLIAAYGFQLACRTATVTGHRYACHAHAAHCGRVRSRTHRSLRSSRTTAAIVTLFESALDPIAADGFELTDRRAAVA
jgi:hypothetical protein